MTGVVDLDQALVAAIVERGFDPGNPGLSEQFRDLLECAASIIAHQGAALSAQAAELAGKFGATGEALAVPLAVGDAWLSETLAGTRVQLQPRAMLDLNGMLARRLVTVTNQTLQFEDVIARSARQLSHAEVEIAARSPQDLLDEWLRRWQTFPVLASLVTSTTSRWRDAVAEMVLAFERDFSAISGRLVPAGAPLEIAAIHGDAGDMHLEGRAVMLVTLASGDRVAYKPKDLAVTDVIRRLVSVANEAGFMPPLRVHDALVRDGHTWEQFVGHRSCTTRAEVRRFYQRMGGWIRLLQMLEGRDFWLDNLIADGEYPHFIDLETILQPRLRDKSLDRASAIGQARLDDSPLATDIVSMRTPIGPGMDSEELGCFALPRPYLSPFPATPIPGVAPRIDERGYRVWEHPEHAPLLEGVPVKAADYYPEIEAGYRAMARVLAGLAPALIADGGLIDQLCAHPVRTIYRDTWTCMKVAQRSVAPPLLGSRQRRQAFLERLGTESAAAQGASEVIAAEVRALSGMDVPFFTALGNNDAIFPPDAPPVPGFFDGTVRERVHRQLLATTPDTIDEDISLLRTAFWTVYPETPGEPRLTRPAPALAADDWLGAALAIGREIQAARLDTGDNLPAWVAVTYHPSVDVDALSPIGSDLLTGRAGLAVFVADLWKATGDDQWRALGTALGRQLVEAIELFTTNWRTADGMAAALGRIPPAIGAFTGIGGHFAALRLLAESLDDASLLRSWREAQEQIAWDGILPLAPGNAIAGASGFMLALSARPGWLEDLPAATRDAVLAHQATGSASGETWSPRARARLAGLPGEEASRLLANRRWGLSDNHDGDLIHSLLASSTLAAGDLLVLAELVDSSSPAWEIVTAALPEPGAGSLDAAESALVRYRQTGDAVWRDEAARIASAWIERRRDQGSWFPDDLADDRYRLSSVWGLPALGSVFLRLAGAPAVASMRTLDWQPWSRQ